VDQTAAFLPFDYFVCGGGRGWSGLGIKELLKKKMNAKK